MILPGQTRVDRIHGEALAEPPGPTVPAGSDEVFPVNLEAAAIEDSGANAEAGCRNEDDQEIGLPVLLQHPLQELRIPL